MKRFFKSNQSERKSYASQRSFSKESRKEMDIASDCVIAPVESEDELDSELIELGTRLASVALELEPKISQPSAPVPKSSRFHPIWMNSDYNQQSSSLKHKSEDASSPSKRVAT